MGIKVNLTGVELKTFEPLPYDRVVIRVKDLVEEKARTSDNQKIRWISTAVCDMEGNQIEGNRQVFYETTLVEDALWNLKRTLVALGDDPEELDEEINIEKEDYIGRHAVAVLYLDDSPEALGTTGKPKQKVSRFEPLPTGFEVPDFD